MKTIFTRLNINKPLIIKNKSYRNYEQAAGDMNRNASKSDAEYQRNACEQELYRLRYGIEKLLANNEYDDIQDRQERFSQTQHSFRPMKNKMNEMNSLFL